MRILFITLTFTFLALFGCQKKEPKEIKIAKSAVIKTVHGNILMDFYPEHAPNTVKRIQELIKSGFYDGKTFHRVEPGFVVQGGDPRGTGEGGTGYKLKAEFSTVLKHQIGSVAMARTRDPDSADCQFYIVIGPASHLDGKYTIFAQVKSGMDAVNKILVGDKMLSVSLKE